jgi:prepilin-type N-terminal cleavage/methylation domain-containing protein
VRKLIHRAEGFTLIELMIVILIIAILVAIAVPVFLNARSNAQRRTCQANQRTVDGAIQSYQANSDTAAYPTSLADMTAAANKTLKSVPLCPNGGASYAWIDGTPPSISCPTTANHTI